MHKLTVYGLPLNPRELLEQLKGASFCVSYATRDKLGAQLDQAIELVGEDSILLVDNGAFTNHKLGKSSFDEDYLLGYAMWANDIIERCPQAIVVLPDVIGGTEEQNWQLACETMTIINGADRSMPIWHLHESIDYLLHLCASFNYVGFGSSGDYWQVGTPKWHARIAEAFAAIDKWEVEGEGAYIRPRIHMMRAQSQAHVYEFDSSDSTNVAMNHNRQLRRSGESVAQFAARIDAKIQASAGPEAEHQIKRPLNELQAITNEFALAKLTELGFEVRYVGDNDNEADDEAEWLKIVANLKAAA